ncbi:MAG: hypothetical protein QM484_02020 [Woeseiaceae bacterium]
MRNFFIFMLFAFNLVSFNQVIASPNLDQIMICNEEAESGNASTDDTNEGDEKNPEDDCE